MAKLPPPLYAIVPKPLVEELGTQDFASVMAYGAECIRRCARQTHGDDSGETRVLRYNMRTLAKRLDRVAKSIERGKRVR